MNTRPTQAIEGTGGVRLAWAGFLEDVAEIGVQSASRIFDWLTEIEPILVAWLPVRLRRRLFSFGRRRQFLTLKQRITLKFLVDKFGQFHVGELQKTDRLLQLWCHHQLLALPHLQFG